MKKIIDKIKDLIEEDQLLLRHAESDVDRFFLKGKLIAYRIVINILRKNPG